MKTFRKSIPTCAKILGIDPGYGRLGFGLILNDKGENKIIEAGLVSSGKKYNWDDRLFEIAAKVDNLFKKHKPDCLALERIFFSRNQKTALKIAEIKGAIVYLAKKRRIPILEFSPNELKAGLTGYGFAGKKQVGEIVKLSLKTKEIQKFDDVSDALALALLAVFQTKITAK